MFDTSTLTNMMTDLSDEMSSTLNVMNSYDEAGLVFAPHEATEAMIDAATKVFDLPDTQLRRIYQVMINSQD
jgi:hypothetical protein